MERIEMTVTALLNGGFYAAHRDAAGHLETRHRLVSCVCYFHRAPRPFVGGDLLLHDAGRVRRCAGA